MQLLKLLKIAYSNLKKEKREKQKEKRAIESDILKKSKSTKSACAFKKKKAFREIV